MSAECFLDTNILVYAASAAPEDAEKQSVALELVRKEDFGLSAQVLHGQQYGPVRVINPFT